MAKAKKAGKSRKWISKAIVRPGALTAKAEAAGQSVQAFAQSHKGASGRLGKQARLAITLKRISRKR